MLAGLGADLVGMSMVPEVIAARHLGGQVLGLAVVSNAAAGTADGPVLLAEMAGVLAGAAGPLARLVGQVIERVPPPTASGTP